MAAAEQLAFLQLDAERQPRWSLEGTACAQCDGGRMYMVHPSEPCGCTAFRCECLAEGYSRCDSCGALKQVFPREMLVSWTPQG